MRNLKFFRQDMKRAFTTKGFFIGTGLLFALFLHAFRLYVSPERGMSTYEIILDAMALSGFGPFAAVFPSLGYSSSFCEEYGSGYLKMITARTSWKTYVRTRMITVGLSGGVIVGLPFLFVCVAAYILGVPGIPEYDFLDGMKILYYIEHYGDGYVLASKVILGFLFGVMFSMISLAFAAWFANRYIAMIAPFILYEAMWMLLYNVQVLNPIYMVRGDDLDSYPLSALMEIIYIVIASVLVWFGMKKRVRYE